MRPGSCSTTCWWMGWADRLVGCLDPERGDRCTMAIEIGEQAPDFTVKDQDGNDVTLSEVTSDRPVALVFYPFTFTGVCEGELCRLRDDHSQFEDAGVQVLAISCDSKNSQK